MQCFNTIKKLIVAPALVIALTAGSVMAGPGQHFDGKAHHSAKIGQSSMSKNGARQAADIGTPFNGKIAAHTTDSSSLGATVNEPLVGAVTFYWAVIPEINFDAQNLIDVLDLNDVNPKRIVTCKKHGC